MTNIIFDKMHGLGNDFVIIHQKNQAISINPKTIQQLANRQIGIGFDQLLLLTSSHHADIYCQIFNADGSEAEQCGNGLRCVAAYLRQHQLIEQDHCLIETKAGVFKASLLSPDLVTLILPLGADINKIIQSRTISLTGIRQNTAIQCVNLGNPHAIIHLDDCLDPPSDQLAAQIANPVLFPQGANVGFMTLLNHHQIKLRTFERGSGETNACGSNACAAALAAITYDGLANKVEVQFKYGSLDIEYEKTRHEIIMTGPATFVFRGEVLI